jgi:hypothetical protein
MCPADNIQSPAEQGPERPWPRYADHPELPDTLRVENRKPLTPEQRALVEAAITTAAAPERVQRDLRAKQRAIAKEKSRIRIEKLLGRKGGAAAAALPLTGRAALAAIKRSTRAHARRQ